MESYRSIALKQDVAKEFFFFNLHTGQGKGKGFTQHGQRPGLHVLGGE